MSNIILNLLSLNSNNNLSKGSNGNADAADAFNDIFNPFKKVLSTTNKNLSINSGNDSIDQDTLAQVESIVGLVGWFTQLVTIINQGQFDDMSVDNQLVNDLAIKLNDISALNESFDFNESNGIFLFAKQLAADLKNLTLSPNATIADVKQLIDESDLQILNQSILALKTVKVDQDTVSINNNIKTLLENLLIDKNKPQSLIELSNIDQKQLNTSKIQSSDFYQVVNQFNSQVDKLMSLTGKSVSLNTSFTNQSSVKSKNNFLNELNTGLSNKLDAPVLMKHLDEQLSWGQSTRLINEPILAANTGTESSSLVAHDLNINLEDRLISSSQLDKLQSSPNRLYQSNINVPFGSDAWNIAFNKQMLHYAKNNIQHAELRLNPKELGAINIQLNLDDNLVKLQLFSGNTNVRNAMEYSLLNLKHAFSEQGFDLSESFIRDENFSNTNERGQADSNDFNNSRPKNSNDEITQQNPQIVSNNQTVINQKKSGIDNFI